MGVEDNQFQIGTLSESQTFLEWFDKTNDELIAKLNLLKVFNGASGDGIDVSVGTTLGSGTAGIMLVQLSGNVTKGITFQDITVNGALNYSFDGSEVKAVTQFSGITNGFTFGNVVRVDDGNTLGLTLARAFNSVQAEAIGLVGSISGSAINVITHGKIQGDFTEVAGGTLSPGCVYFLDPNNYGKITVTEPSNTGNVSKPVLVGITGDTGLVLNYRGQELGFSGGTGSSIGSLKVLIQLGSAEAANFEVGKFVSKNNISGANPTGSRTKSSDVFYSSAADPFISTANQTTNVHKNDLVGVITSIDSTNDILEVLTRGYLQKSVLKVQSNSSFTNTPFYLSNGQTENSGDPDLNSAGVVSLDGVPTDVQLGHIIDSDTVFIDPIIIQTDVFSPPGINERNFLGGGVGVSFGIQTTDAVINGSFDIWQRHIGTDSAYSGNTSSNSLYFADRWAFLNGIDSTSLAGGTFGIERKSFTLGQDDVLGEPTYYARITNNYSGFTATDYIHVENRLDSSEYFLNETGVISVYTKSPSAGSTVGVYYKQYFDNGVGASGDSTTTYIGNISLSSSWTANALSFTIPGLTGSQTITGDDHYAAIAFDITGVTGTYIDFSQLQFELGTNPTAPRKKDKAKVLDQCRKFYQRSYDEEVSARTSTMAEDTIPNLTAIDIPVNYSKDYYYNFPIKMRLEPSVTLYSPSSGVTSDGYNRLAQLDMRLTSGTVGPNGQVRKSRVNQPTIQVGNTADNGIRFEIVSGAVVGDQVSVHYVADADINKNL
jgi:hypothetical protein